jgi:hypothetical protein
MVQRIGHGITDPEMEVRLFLGALQARLAHQQSAPPTPERQEGQHLHWVLVVTEQRSDEGGCDPSRRGGSTLRSPQASVTRDGKGAVRKTVASARQVRFLRLALSSRSATDGTCGSGPQGSRFDSCRERGARLAGGGRRPAKPPVAGFDFLVRLPARRPRDRAAVS